MKRIEELATYQPPLSASVISQTLKEEFGDRVPAERTVRDILQTIRPDPSEPWDLAKATIEAAALILPVWQAVIDYTDGKAHVLSQGEAKWIRAIRRLCPDQPRPGELSYWLMYLLAREFTLLEQRGEPTTAPEAFLGYAPWRGFREAWRYETAIREKRIPPLHSRAVLLPELPEREPDGWTEETRQAWMLEHGHTVEEGSDDHGNAQR